MIKVAFVTQHSEWPWARQIPREQTRFAGAEFFVPLAEADCVLVYDALPSASCSLPSSAKTIFFASEPPSVKKYNVGFLAQFDFVVTPDRETYHPNRIFTQAGLPWHVGTMSSGGVLIERPMSFEDLETYQPIKTKLVSVVSSDKNFTQEHRARLAFVRKLKEALGDQVDFFGRGIADFADKRDVLDAYRYHIALENSAIEDYWTEKLADPYLTLTFPIYHGCTNVSEYFEKDSFRLIDIYDPDNAIAIIRDVIGSDLAEQSEPQLREARRRVMYEHNFFSLAAKIVHQVVDEQAVPVSDGRKILLAESKFTATSGSPARAYVAVLLTKFPILLKAVRWGKRRFTSVCRKAKRFISVTRNNRRE